MSDATPRRPAAVPRLLPEGTLVHLVGVGGAGMSALATILLERGHPVSGSDLRGGRALAGLAAMGARVHVGHQAAYVDGAALVAVSTAVPASNPEVVRAEERGIPVVTRAELLAALMVDRRALLIAGTHGKTTTTAMTTVCLQTAGLDPSFAIGGALHESGTAAHHGTGDVFVAEADESDRSFLSYLPHCAVVKNVELDHHETYADLGAVVTAFGDFLVRRPAGGLAVVCRDDAGAAALVEQAAGPLLTYGEHPDADLRLTDVALDAHGSSCTLVRGSDELVRLTLLRAGRHSLLNAAAAAAGALWAGAGWEAVARGLAGFTGAQRRFQRVGTAAGVTVIDDYAHHPTELAVNIAAAHQTVRAGRVVAVFQPHLYSRTAALCGEFGHALAGADLVVVTDVYGAREAPVPGVTGGLIAEAARAAGVPTHYVPAASDLPMAVAELVSAGDLVLTFGAGDITEVGPALLAVLRERHTDDDA
ncbi:UDP-N-acetylmuramate--L-alanine ligase [soil metagenome]